MPEQNTPTAIPVVSLIVGVTGTLAVVIKTP